MHFLGDVVSKLQDGSLASELCQTARDYYRHRSLIASHLASFRVGRPGKPTGMTRRRKGSLIDPPQADRLLPLCTEGTTTKWQHWCLAVEQADRSLTILPH